MLMFGWVADRHLIVRDINVSLRRWLRDRQIDVSDLERGICLREFFDRICGRNDCSVGELLERHLRVITSLVEQSPEQIRGKVITEGDFEILQVVKDTQEGHRLAAVRVVKPGGICLKEERPQDRVDLINVCHIERNGPAGWRVTGYQGQLQEAWMRVVPVIREGTKSGTVGLMGRNLSHNIGSHALYWIEQDEKDTRKSLFFRYLRERMELLAGFATSMPLSTITVDLQDVIAEMSANELLWANIARSEQVHKITFNAKGCNRKVALPGIIGKQAFFTIVENIIRDCAKFGRPGREMQVTITAGDVPGTDDYVRVVLHDECGNAEYARANLESALRNLRISDEAGRLLPQHWGIKERFISAALLRGVRLETFDPKDPVGHACHDELPMLQVEDICCNDSKNLGWVWYLLKPKDVLVIEDSGAHLPSDENGVTVRDARWLEQNLDHPSAIRHRFVVAPGDLFERLDSTCRLEKLPARVIPMPAVCFASNGNGPGKHLTLWETYRMWLDGLLRGRKMPAILFGDSFRKGRLQPTRDGGPQVYFWPNHKFEEAQAQLQGSGAPLIVFDRHHTGLPWARKTHLLMYEPHESKDPVRAIAGMEVLSNLSSDALALRAMEIAEAALTRVIVIDERLDESNQGKNYTTDVPGVTYKTLFEWKGVDLAGREYSQEKIPGPDFLYSKIPEGRYDFALIHRGILDKLRDAHGITLAELCSEIQPRVRQLIIHSGRMSMHELPKGVKFLPLSAPVAWFDQNYSKMQIVDELNLLRKVG